MAWTPGVSYCTVSSGWIKQSINRGFLELPIRGPIKNNTRPTTDRAIEYRYQMSRMSGYDSVQQKRRCVEYGRSPATGKESLVFSYMVNSNQRHLKKTFLRVSALCLSLVWHCRPIYYIQGGPKIWLTICTSNIDLFSNFFHCQNPKKIKKIIILSLKIPPHLKCFATLPREMSMS